MLRKTILASVLTLGFACGFSSAQTGPTGPAGSFPNPNPPTGQGVLTEQTLPQMLQAAGFQYQEATNPSNGVKTWRVQVTSNGWRFDMTLELIKTNGQYQGYGISSPLAVLNSNPNVAIGQMEKVLAQNFNIVPGGYRFALNTATKTIMMVQDLYDTNMNVNLLRDDLNRFMKQVQNTHQTWAAPAVQ